VLNCNKNTIFCFLNFLYILKNSCVHQQHITYLRHLRPGCKTTNMHLLSGIHLDSNNIIQIAKPHQHPFMADGNRTNGQIICPWIKTLLVGLGYNSCGHFHYKDSAIQQCSYTVEQTEIAKINNYQERFLNYTLQPVAIETSQYSTYGMKTAPFFGALAKKLVITLVNPRSTTGYNNACCWLWSEAMLPTF